MEKINRLKRSDDLYVEPLNEKEIIKLKQYILKMNKMQSEYKEPSEIKNPSLSLKTSEYKQLSEIKNPSLSLKTSDKMQSEYKEPSNLLKKTLNTVKQTGGMLMTNAIIGPGYTSSTLIDELVRIKGLPGLQNTTMLILFKRALPGDPPGPQIRLTQLNGAFANFTIHVYVYQTNAKINSTLITPFCSHLNFGPERNVPIPGNARSNIYDTYRYNDSILITAPDFDANGVPMLNLNVTINDIRLDDLALNNLIENEINVGIIQPQSSITYLISTEHTNTDIDELRSYTTGFYSVINAWLNIPGETNQPGFLANQHALHEIAMGRTPVELIQLMRDKVNYFDNFVYTKGRLSSITAGHAVSFYANHQPPNPPPVAWQAPPRCNVTIHTSTVYRGMSRPYVGAVVAGIVRVPSYLHTSVDREQALNFAQMGLFNPGANPIIYRITVGPNIPYWAYDEKFLKSAIPGECEIIFARNCSLITTEPARVLPLAEWDTNGIPVEDVSLYWTSPPRPVGWVPGTPDEDPEVFIATKHTIQQTLFDYYPVRLFQYNTANDIRANIATIFNMPGVNVAHNGGRKTKKYKKKAN